MTNQLSEKPGIRYGVLVRRDWVTLLLFGVMSGIALLGYKYPTAPREWLARVWPADNEAETSAAETAPAATTGKRDRNGGRRRNADRPIGGMTLFSSEVMILASCDDFFRPAAARAIRDVVDTLTALPEVSYITWMDNAPPLNIFGLPEPALPDHRSSQTAFDLAKQRAMKNPMIAGQLLSRDTKHVLLLLQIDWYYVRSDSDCTTKLLDTANATLAKHADVSMTFGLTGDMPLRLRIGEQNKENDRKFQYICYAGVLLMAAILFRGLSAVIISALPVAVGIFWSFGFIRFLDMEENPFNFVVVPVLLSMVGFTDSVHIIAQMRANRLRGLTTREAIAAALDEVGGACFLTSFTTAIGFGSLWWAHHKVVQEFGICCVVGAAVMFVAVLTTIPLACRTWLGHGIQRGEIGGWVERNFYRYTPVLNGILRRPKLFSALAVMLTLVTGAMMWQLEPDERLFNGIPEDTPEAMALRQIDQAFGGLETSYVSAAWPRDLEPSTEQIVAWSDSIEEMLKAEPMLGSPLGLAGLVEALPGTGELEHKASLTNLLPPQLKQLFWRPDTNELIVVFRLQDVGIASYGPVFERIDRQLAQLSQKYPEVKVNLDGSAVWRWKHLYRIIMDLAKSLGSASIVIFVVLGVFYRSARIGLIAVIPNLFPLTVTGAGMWLTGQSLELVSVLAFTVCLGIAVDDTIHFLSRYQSEKAAGHERSLAIRRSALGGGAAMVMTTVVLLAGFSTVLLSDSREHHIFALMGGSTIGMAIIGDLVFLPALLLIFDRPSKVTANVSET